MSAFSKIRCPKCYTYAVCDENGCQCNVCDLYTQDSERLWYSGEDTCPSGFDKSSAVRLERLRVISHFWARERQSLFKRLLRRLTHEQGHPWEAALELGCGTGEMLQILEDSAHRVVAIDGHRTLLQRAHAVSRQTRLIQGDLTKTSLSGDQFDLIVAFDVLEHVDADGFFARSKATGP